MSSVASELQKAWDESAQESGFHTPEKMTIYKAEKARERFYQLFFQKTGLHDSVVRGLFNDWSKTPSDEVLRLRVKHDVTHSFCAYLAEYIERKTALAGMSTAYHHEDEEVIHGEVH